MTGKELTRMVAALAIGAAIAFPGGLWVAGRGGTDAPTPRQPPSDRRAIFSPDVRGDPHVRDQFRQQVEALEAHCRGTGELCAEAGGARQRYEELAKR